MKFGVVVFPGSNCDHDAFYAIGNVLQKPVEFIWHQSENLANCDAIILPGGFSYGDYLRTGAIARFSPVMKSVEKFAKSGGMVLGICNGFQILCEAGLLPGAMMRNSGLRFICRHVHIRVEQTDTPFTNAAQKSQILKIPIAPGDFPLHHSRRFRRQHWQSQRRGSQYRRTLQSRTQCRGPHAPSRARRRIGTRLRRRPVHFPLHG